MIIRIIETDIESYLKGKDRKILFVWGPRRSGKTTLLKKYAGIYSLPVFNFDLLSEREKFAPDAQTLKKIAKEHKVILIDEVQNYPESSLALKILHDEYAVKIIATGSSELRQTSKDFDTLAGRFRQIFCLPLSAQEIAEHVRPKMYERKAFFRIFAERAQIFGTYPEIYTEEGPERARIDTLQNLLDTYVLKDIIDIYHLKNTKLAKDILIKIALQLGSEVSVREIANSLQANVSTVSSYIEIFIKNYVLIPVPSFKTNARRAVSEHRKLYFYDIGIRNILVKDFRPLELRPDRGGVFENFIISEIEKRMKVLNVKQTIYFYREYGGKEVDIVLEDYHKRYTCLEVKTGNEKARKTFPLPHMLETINQDNYFAKLEAIVVP
ncbi:MAG: ATP-binding protein [Patescibacteria group bacterium]